MVLEEVKDLGVIIDTKCSFKPQRALVILKVKRKASWVLRTFQDRSLPTMRTLWSSLVRPHQDYASQLWAPVASLPAIRDQEAPLRAFTKRVAGLRDLHYWERLALTGLSSTERRADRYRVLYAWKVIAGLVPNCGLGWTVSERRGLLLTVSPISGSRMAIRSLREASFFSEAPRAFNALPKALRGFSGSLGAFKSQLDKILLDVPDLPVSLTRTTFATDWDGRETNSLAHWFRALSSSSLARQIHTEHFGSGTRVDIIRRLFDTNPDLACLRSLVSDGDLPQPSAHWQQGATH